MYFSHVTCIVVQIDDVELFMAVFNNTYGT